MVAIIGIPMSWVAYQLNWIRQRREYIRKTDTGVTAYSTPPLGPFNPPWNLRIFGDQGYAEIGYTKEQEELARSLFPEHFPKPAK